MRLQRQHVQDNSVADSNLVMNAYLQFLCPGSELRLSVSSFQPLPSLLNHQLSQLEDLLRRSP